MQRWQIYATLMLAAAMVATAHSAEAQTRTSLSRAAIDSLVNPTLSTKAQGALRAECEVIDVGKCDDTTMHNIDFEIRNTSGKELTITALRASCSCLKVTTAPQRLAKDATLTLTTKLNTAGRNGEFNHNILVYTSEDELLPTLRLTIRGYVEQSDRWQHLPESAGTLRMSRRSVTLDNVEVGSRRHERIACANSGTCALRLHYQSTVRGLELRCEPEILEPGCEGNIIISYTPQGEQPIDEWRTALLIEGVDASPSERMIDVKIRR